MKIEEQIRNFLLDNLLKNEPSDIIQRIKKPLDPEYFTLNEKGLKSEDSGFEIILLPLVFSMLFSISIFASSGFLLQSVIEEKENRIMEVILSSVSHKDLLTGKIIGLGALGLTPGIYIFDNCSGDIIN
ncbi:MAG: ATP-dependent Na+ efflux pump [Candidatus Methanoperedens nitroreducens]|uniref:ATP-dependent Na+ efflux pump n=1 Tax=Candidatus Methanoperedens nitratireducens TaxID=1392998 RepID=A0A0P8A201_9EURY|nr:MAG: ATP-dependent Na+ efflux pump [Candidatus Methanoperedens sp. BLZ1]